MLFRSEIVKRRLLSLIKNNEDWPDLLLIDGGQAQLNFALKGVEEVGSHHGTFDVVALAKREEELYSPKFPRPVQLGKAHDGLKVLQHVRDESHRFAVTFQRKKRTKQTFS